MIENTPIFTPEKKNNNDYIKTRVEIKKKIWRVFKGIVSMKDLSIPDAMTEAIVLWLDEIETVKHICCVCKNEINNDYIRKMIDGDIVYYCSTECIIKEQANINNKK